jgi:hypothetical protein
MEWFKSRLESNGCSLHNGEYDFYIVNDRANELLAALKASLIWASTTRSLYPNHTRDGGNIQDDVIMIEAAIAKAEGKD